MGTCFCSYYNRYALVCYIDGPIASLIKPRNTHRAPVDVTERLWLHFLQHIAAGYRLACSTVSMWLFFRRAEHSGLQRWRAHTKKYILKVQQQLLHLHLLKWWIMRVEITENHLVAHLKHYVLFWRMCSWCTCSGECQKLWAAHGPPGTWINKDTQKI